MQNNLVAINSLELLDNILGSIGGVVVDDDDFEVDLVFLCSLEQKVDDQWEVVAFLVRWH